jgi:hypothetical protein
MTIIESHFADAHTQIGEAYGINGPRLGELKRQFDPQSAFLSAIPLPLAS